MELDPIIDPPAIVREAEADWTEKQIRDAMKALKRGMILDKRAYGVWLDRLKKKVGYGRWDAVCREIGLVPRTAHRWIAKATEPATIPDDLAAMEAMEQSFATSDKMSEVDEPPSAATPSRVIPFSKSVPQGTDQLYCRDCRTTGAKPGCRKCIAFRKSKATLFAPNEEPPADPDVAPVEPEAERPPLVDVKGKGLPEAARAAWECPAIEEWIEQYGRPAYRALSALEGKPGTLHTNIEGIKKRQHAIANMLRSSKPKYRCEVCEGAGCETCKQTGVVSGAILAEAKEKEKAKAWNARKRDQGPIPE